MSETTAEQPKARAQRRPVAQPTTASEERRPDLTRDLAALADPRPYGQTSEPIPPEVEKFVEAAYEAWKRNPAAWQVVALSGEAAAQEVFGLARQYAARRAQPLTVRRKRTDDPAQLVYQVRDKIKQRRQATAPAAVD